VTNHVEENARATDEAHEQAKAMALVAKASQDKMQELTGAMRKIEDTSKQIGNIIENIEDIASQTNLLSLNAAIEAAKAGKGFAVVADQIRKLAEQSAESAVDTRKLIEASIAEVAVGGRITKDTADHLDNVMQGLDEILLVISDVRMASDKQAVAIKNIEQGVAQITSVVENNSAAAEESSATSEELSAQSESLNSLVNRFQLRK
jgi:methyl-accepting chemotaxis protein